MMRRHLVVPAFALFACGGPAPIRAMPSTTFSPDGAMPPNLRGAAWIDAVTGESLASVSLMKDC